MRNLMGRLNTRSDEDLQRIAVAWLVPSAARDRAGLIAQLMRAMTDLRAVRDFWARRSDSEREMITYFVANGSEQGVAAADLAVELGHAEEQVRSTANRLYQAGVLATTAQQQPLQIGEIPRLFLPRELGQLFARIQDELDAGDISRATPAAVLELLDDADIQRAAEHWGLESMPGLRTRRELTEGLLELVPYPDRRAVVERKLGWDARRILATVAELPAGQTVPLADVAEKLELDPDQPRTADRLRAALEALEEALLVWHTWLPDGTRALFQPIWPPPERTETRGQAQPPEPIEAEPADLPSKHPAALAWDLLSLLRWLGAGTPTVASLSSATVRARRQLDAHLWNRGGDEPLPGYLEFLAALAEYENLLEPPDSETRTQRSLRAWRARAFEDQMLQLISHWMGAVTWIEAQDQEEVVVTGAHWPQFRRRLLVLLSDLEPDRWYRLDDLARWLSHRSSDALGDSVKIATARPTSAAIDRSSERLSSLEQVIERTLRSGFVWFGLVEIGHIPAIGEVVRLTDATLSASGLRERSSPLPPEGAPLDIHPDLTVTLRDPSPVRVWSLTAFAEQVRLMPTAEYRMTNRSLQRALSAGFRVEDVVTFLERQTGDPLDNAARAQLGAWAESMGRVWLAPALIIQTGHDTETRSLRAPLTAAGLHIESCSEGLLAQGSEGMSAAALAEKVSAVLRELGKTPQIRTTHEPLAGSETRS